MLSKRIDRQIIAFCRKARGRQRKSDMPYASSQHDQFGISYSLKQRIVAAIQVLSAKAKPTFLFKGSRFAA